MGCGFEQACGNVCDIAKGIQISLTIDIPMPGAQKPTCLGGEPMRQEQIKDFRGKNTSESQDKLENNKDNKNQDLSFIKPGDKPDKEDEDDKDERWH